MAKSKRQHTPKGSTIKWVYLLVLTTSRVVTYEVHATELAARHAGKYNHWSNFTDWNKINRWEYRTLKGDNFRVRKMEVRT